MCAVQECAGACLKLPECSGFSLMMPSPDVADALPDCILACNYTNCGSAPGAVPLTAVHAAGTDLLGGLDAVPQAVNPDRALLKTKTQYTKNSDGCLAFSAFNDTAMATWCSWVRITDNIHFMLDPTAVF